jgi:TolA-binding protein
MSRTARLAAALAVVAALAGAQAISVDFVLGSVESLQAGEWSPLSAGSAVDPAATLRLGADAVAELSSGGVRVSVAGAGTFAVGELFAQRAAARRDMGAFLTSALREMISPSRERGRAHGGRAGIDQGPVEWADEDKEALESARRLMQAGRTEEAARLLARARGQAADKGPFDFLIACSAALEGRTGAALAFLRALQADDPMQLGGDASALHAQLALQAGSYVEAAAAARACVEGFPDGAQAQGCRLIEGLALRALGREAEARAAFEGARSGGPETEAGLLAARQLR